MYVVGATQVEHIDFLRTVAPDNFFLVPGVGAQGGSLKEVSKFGMNRQCGLLVNSSRGIIYADQGKDFATAAAKAANNMRDDMKSLLDLYCS